MTKGWRVAALIAVLLGTLASASAQNTAPRDLPRLDLSESQRHTIYLSVSNQPNLKSGAPSTFQPLPGAHVPAEVKLFPMPNTIVEMIPQTTGYEVAFVASQVLIVEPAGKRVIDVITDSGGR